MRTLLMPYLVVMGTCCGAIACERRAPAPMVGDASTTSAAAPASEQTLEPGATDAGTSASTPPAPSEPVAADAGVSAGTPPPATVEPKRPSWVPEDATLTVVRSVDRDRNLGIALPVPVTAFTVDAGSCDVGIEVRPKP